MERRRHPPRQRYLRATHRAPGAHWGITQHRFVGGRIIEEWLLFNEFEVMQQIYRDRPPEK